MLCPFCRTENRPGALRCAACTSWMTDRPPAREWLRARDGRLLGGVARGLSNRFALPVAVVRLVFLLGILFAGWTILLYVALWIAMPLEPWPAAALPPKLDEPATASGPGS
jgi:phage shock protein C